MFGIPIDLHLGLQLARPHSPDDDAPLAGRPQAPQRYPGGRPHFTPFGPDQDTNRRARVAHTSPVNGEKFDEAENKSSGSRVTSGPAACGRRMLTLLGMEYQPGAAPPDAHPPIGGCKLTMGKVRLRLVTRDGGLANVEGPSPAVLCLNDHSVT